MNTQYVKQTESGIEFFKNPLKALNGDTIYNPSHEMLIENGWTVYEYVPTEEELAEQALLKAKMERAAAVAAITVEVDGLVFDGDEESQQRMARAITMFQANNLPAEYTTAWVLADNSISQVTISQLSQALLLAGQRQTELWTKPYETSE